MPPVGQFMYKTKILFLLPIDSVKPINRMEDECLGALKTEKYENLMDKCHDISIKVLENEVKRISPNTFVIYAKNESTLEIKCLSETGKREVRELTIKGFKKVSIEKNCMGNFQGELLYSDSSFESNNKNYWLPIEIDFESDFKKHYPGLDEEKILKSLENMPKNAQHKIGDLLKYAAQIDHNNAMIDHMANQGIHNKIFYIIGSIVLGYIIYQLSQKCTCNSHNTNGGSTVIRG